MARLTFVNLPVADLERAVGFFAGLGFTFDARFADERAACMVVSEHSYVMLLVTDFFAGFTGGKEVADATRTTEVVLGVSAADRDEVDTLVDRALGLGAAVAADPQDHGSMYGRSFHDLDGHAWEVIWMDPQA